MPKILDVTISKAEAKKILAKKYRRARAMGERDDGGTVPRLTVRREQELMRVRAEGSIGEGHGATYRVRNALRHLGLLELFSAEPLGQPDTPSSLYRPTRWRLTSKGRWVAAMLSERAKR